MITLLIDLNTEVLLDFNLDEHRFTRVAIKHGREGMSDEQAVVVLTDLWNAD